MIEVAEIDDHADGSSHEAHAGGLAELREALVADGVDEVSDDHEEDDEHIIICHLHVVGLYLKRREYGCDDESPQILATIGKHNARYHRRQISQGYYLPDVSGGYDDEEIGAERPYYGAKHSQLATEIEGSEKDVESEKVSKDVPHVLGKPEMIKIAHLIEDGLAVIRRSHLISRHASEERVGPACAFSGTLIILRQLHSRSASCGGVVTIKDASFGVCREEIGKRDDSKNQCYQ